MLLYLVQSFLRATVSNQFTEVSILRATVSNQFTEVSITSIHACTIWIFHTSVYDCTFIAPTDGWYF